MPLLIENALVVTMDAARRVLEPGHLLVDGRRLAAVGPGPYAGGRAGLETYDAAGRIVLPGLVNAHTHSYGNLVKGSLDNLPLELWMLHVMAQGRRMEPADVEVNAALGAVEMLKGGVTTCLDQLAEDGANLARVAGVSRRLGLRAVLAPMFGDVPYGRTLPEVVALPGGDRPHVGPGVPATVDGILAMVAEVAAECHRPADGLTIGVGPSGPQRCTDALLLGAMDLAERLGLPFHTHLLETRAQAATADRLYGRSMVRHLHALGLLRPRVSVAHAVWLEPADVDLLARGGVRVVTNPVSNLAVGSGIAPLLALRRAGVGIGLGTDGANAAGRQSVFEVMKLAAMLAKLQTRDFAGWPTALEVLEMATLGGARALGLDDRAGALEPGKEADLLVLRRDATALTPLTDVAWQLVYGRPEEAIERVMVAGRVVVEGGRVLTVDEPGLLAEARERGGRLIEGYRREVDAIGRLHPSLAAVLARAYGGPCGALAARWHGEAAGAGPA